MQKLTVFVIVMAIVARAMAQPSTPGRISIVVMNGKQAPLSLASVELLRGKDSSLVTTRVTNAAGLAMFENMPPGNYLCRITMVDHVTQYTGLLQVSIQQPENQAPAVVLQPVDAMLKAVTVAGRKSFIRQMADKTIVNVEASITSAGATVMEVLEKSPGVSVDRDGNISLKGRPNVLILIDGKPTYVSGSDLAGMLNSMSAAQVEQIEIMDNPPAKYDAAGNAGIINIKTKKNRQEGFNGSLTTGYTQGVYPKTNNNLLLNYRTGKFNVFLNYSLNAGSNFADLYALRSYYKEDGKTIDALLQQPTLFTGTAWNHTAKTGLDYSLSKKTTIGLVVTGMHHARTGKSRAPAQWMNAAGGTDSVIISKSNSSVRFKNWGINLNARHVFNASQELTADLDFLGYRISNYQFFQNNLDAPGGYEEAIEGFLPSRIRILSAKADYTQQVGSTLKLEGGWKSSRVTTDNNAGYFYRENNNWITDLGKTNHFLYTENIHAVYGNIEKQVGKFTLQGGLRYEYTGYDATQLGNAIRKDSSFSRRYNSLFPTAYISYKADTLHTFSLSAGRRIDRPAFQKLNPFVFVINKYTNQQGNPYFLPQYTWNIELTHQFRELLTTSVSYSRTSDYFSQVFLTDSNNTFIYTEGNVGSRENFGLSVSAQAEPLSWWSFSVQTDLVHKKINGFVWKAYDASITQLSINWNNQFRFKKGWAGELTGYYITRSQEDLQEVLEPTGQVSAGVSKQILKNKVTLKLSVRDIFYTQAMEGFTQFKQSGEYFKLTRDSRVVAFALTWRFGKPAKGGTKRSGGAEDEIKRVGTGA